MQPARLFTACSGLTRSIPAKHCLHLYVPLELPGLREVTGLFHPKPERVHCAGTLTVGDIQVVTVAALDGLAINTSLAQNLSHKYDLKARPHALHVVRAWAAKGYQPVYLSGRQVSTARHSVTSPVDVRKDIDLFRESKLVCEGLEQREMPLK